MNKTFFKSILFVGLAACMFSCKDDNSPLDGGNTPQGVNVEFDYSQAKLGKSAGSSATLNGSSDVDWTIEVEEGDFFSVEPMSGKAGDFTLTVTANKENTSTDKAYSKFIFNASGRKYPITVIHLEDDIRLEPSYDAETVFSFAQNGTLLSPDLTAKAFTATSNIEWTVKTVNEADTWIKVGPEVGEIGENLPVTVVVDENPFAKVREGKFEVRVPEAMSFQYTVTQAAAPLDYEIKDGEKVLTEQTGLTGFGGGGETRTITLNANADWKIEPGTDSEWLTFEPSEGVASLEPVEVKVTVEPNPNMDNDQGRSGSFTVTFGEGTSKEISVQQNKGEIPVEVTKLQALEDDLEGDNSAALDWSNSADYETWDGVKFEGGKLVELNLANRGLKGYVPAEIVDFASLRLLDLSNNELTANTNLPKIIVNKSSIGKDVINKTGGAPFDQSYTPAIPIGIKDLINLTTFKLSGNKIEGIFPSDVVNNPNYLKWDAMANIYPQQGDNANISYDSNSTTRYAGADPAKWKFKLTQIGVLRVMYYAMGGENWNDKDFGNTEPAWLNKEFVIAQDNGVYPSENSPRVTAVSQVGGNQDVQKFEVGNVSGSVPEECLMNSGLAHMWVDGTNANYKLSGSIHPLIIQRLNYLQFKNHDLDMSVNFIFANLRNSVSNIAFQNNANIDGTIDISLLTGTVDDGKLSFGSFILTGTGIQGTVKVSDVKGKFKPADQANVTVEGLQAKFPATVNVTE
jgi:hypothetical protein